MTEISVYEAKTRLSSLLDRVERGESFTITRHGKAIAELRPQGRFQRDPAKLRATFAKIGEVRERSRMAPDSIETLVKSGRP